MFEDGEAAEPRPSSVQAGKVRHGLTQKCRLVGWHAGIPQVRQGQLQRPVQSQANYCISNISETSYFQRYNND